MFIIFYGLRFKNTGAIYSCFLFTIFYEVKLVTGKLPQEDFAPTNSSWIRVTVWVRVRVRGYIPRDNLPGSNFPSNIKIVYWFSADWETSNFLTIGTSSLR